MIIRNGSTKQDSPRNECCFIQIPHIDPGRDKYGNQPESLRRLLFLTWMTTLKIGQIMINTLQQHGKGKCRLEICDSVLSRYNAECKDLIEELDTVRNELSKEWSRVND